MPGNNVRTRKLASLPPPVLMLFPLLLCLQLFWASVRPAPAVHISDLPPPPSINHARLIALGDDVFLSRILILWLQAYDTQPGRSLSYREIDYGRLTDWLDLILRLDPRAQYPLLLASRVYAEVNDPGRQRTMIGFVAEKFSEFPDRRWRWMAQVIYVARHRLQDVELALDLARQLAHEVTDETIPHWAQQMHIYILEDMGRIEAAKVLLGGLIESGEIDDPNEIRFLKKRLEEMESDDR